MTRPRTPAAGTTTPDPADVKHAPVSRTRLTQALCGSTTGTRQDAWTHVTCTDCKNA